MMKKILFMVAAVAALAMVSCNKEGADGGTEAKEPSVVVEFSASISMGDENTAVQPQSSAATRTTVDLEGGKTKWEKDDIIFINGVKFKVKELRNESLSAVFVNVSDLAESFKAPYIAIYSGNDNDNTMNVPNNQTAVEGVLDAPVCAAAYSENTTLKFKHAASILKFSVPVACSSVTLSSDSNLAGNVTMTDDEKNPFTDGGEKTVTINGNFETGKNYYVAVTPGTKKNFAVKIEDYVVKSAESVEIGRSKIITMSLPYNVYLHAKTSKYDWTSDGARFATWTWGTGVTDSWFDMVPEGHEDVYRLEVPTGYKNIIFCRANGGVTNNDWKNVWNQTADQVIPNDNKNHFYISDVAIGTWGDKDYTFPVIKPKDGYLYLKPSSEWLQSNAHFAAWIWKDSGAGKVYNFKAHESVPGIYELNLNGSNKMIIFRMDPNKKVTDGSSTWPGDNQWYKSGNLNITGNLYTVVGWHAAGTGFSTITEF